MTTVTHVRGDLWIQGVIILFIWGRLILEKNRGADSAKEVVGIGWDHQIGSNWLGF